MRKYAFEVTPSHCQQSRDRTKVVVRRLINRFLRMKGDLQPLRGVTDWKEGSLGFTHRARTTTRLGPVGRVGDMLGARATFIILRLPIGQPTTRLVDKSPHMQKAQSSGVPTRVAQAMRHLSGEDRSERSMAEQLAAVELQPCLSIARLCFLMLKFENERCGKQVYRGDSI